MKAKLLIQDIGGLKGQHSFEFESGKLNILESSNSGGKTTVVRALAAVLSTPADGDFGRFALNEAIKLGIRTEETNLQEGFVNVHADKGLVQLVMPNDSRRLVVKQDGGYEELSVNGDSRFLLAGILSNDTKILRQLRDIDDQHEPDDFRWAVSELSYASRYDEISRLVSTRRDKLTDRLFVVDKKSRKRKELTRKRAELLKKKESLDRELQTIKSKHKEIKGVLDERDELRRKISEWTETIGSIKGALSNIRAKLSSLEEGIQQTTKEAKSLESQLKSSELVKIKEYEEKRRVEIQAEVNELIQERSNLDGILNLLVTAQSSIRKERRETKCPLCQNGFITFRDITLRLQTSRKQRDELNGKISGLNLEKHRLGMQLQKEIERMKNLKENIGTLLDRKQKLSTEYQQLKSSIMGDEDKIQDYQEKIKNADQKIQHISNKIGPEHEVIQKAYMYKEDEHRKISEEIAVINQQITETAVELIGFVIDPEPAKKIIGDWLNALDELIEFSEERAEEQRQQAAKEFNTSVKKLMQKLEFKEFRTVMLNRDYRLYIERLNPGTEKYVFQQARTLSTSEKLSIALILQAALKEIYIPDTPFFVLDDIIEDFDDDRRKMVLEYLIGKAKEKDWFTVITKLVEGPQPISLHVIGV